MSSTALPSPRRRCPTPGGTHGRLKSRGLHRKTRKPENQRKTKKPSIGTPGGEVKYGRTWDRNCLGVGIVLSGEGGFLPWSGTLWWLHAAHPIPSGLKVARAWLVGWLFCWLAGWLAWCWGCCFLLLLLPRVVRSRGFVVVRKKTFLAGGNPRKPS